MKILRAHTLSFSAIVAIIFLCLCLCGCTAAPQAKGVEETTSGSVFEIPTTTQVCIFTEENSETSNGAQIDTSQTSFGYVGVRALSSDRLKFQIKKGDAAYVYDLNGDEVPQFFPINLGDGAYSFHVMKNVGGSNYVQIASATSIVNLNSEFEPFLRPNVYCNYSSESLCIQKAKELASSAKNEGDVVKSVYNWMINEITYDKAKAMTLSKMTGYFPSPDETLNTKSGICIDYASLAAAMFRSLGIPCQIVTGYVSPDNIYHAWNMIYIDGQWISAQISVNQNEWTRIDVTFAAGGATPNTVGDGTNYTDRYTY